MSVLKIFLIFFVCSIFAGAFLVSLIALLSMIHDFNAFQAITFNWKPLVGISVATGVVCTLISGVKK